MFQNYFSMSISRDLCDFNRSRTNQQPRALFKSARQGDVSSNRALSPISHKFAGRKSAQFCTVLQAALLKKYYFFNNNISDFKCNSSAKIVFDNA